MVLGFGIVMIMHQSKAINMEEEPYSRDYVEKHKKIKERFESITNENICGCVPVKRLADDLKMDQRTVRSHLEIITMHKEGVYLDPENKIFCSKKGVMRLAEKVGLRLKDDNVSDKR